ncbi:flagellar export chaperone FlgN [Campylobacter rectus]|uniref:flagellar export chaperone FlgN n=1 Tax=Campylobacter rectus TaxID=203 RepID=UPI000F5FD0FC|nr:flagellar export chaperone FlgN [Campylobacter rectus]RRD54655.1 flagellar biosynthesis protein FlgN [Campylobacter rectus]
MLKRYLDEAMGVLDELIAQTTEDIENIKLADHSKVDDSVRRKNELVKKFESVKSLLDKELLRVSKENGGANLSSILDDEVKSSLALMRSKLEELYSKNKEYAKYVVGVKEFFDSLLKNMFKGEQDGGYDKNGLRPESLFKTRV